MLVQAFKAHGFCGPCAWYLNDDANITDALKAPNGGRLSKPVLFVYGDFDQVNTINGIAQAIRCAGPAQTLP